MSRPVGVCAICKEPAFFKCSACHSVFYCGKEHQLSDWRLRHKANCLACKVQVSPKRGQYVVATRNIKKDDVIVQETPLVVGPFHLKQSIIQYGSMCISCLTDSEDNVPCPRCFWLVCNKSCPELRNLDGHGAECELLSKLAAPSHPHALQVLLPLRCLLLQKSNPQKWKIFQEMAFRAAGVIPTTASQESRNTFVKTILKPLIAAAPELLPDRSAETVKLVFDALDAYGLGVCCSAFGPAFAIFPVTSLMEHRCLANTRRPTAVPVTHLGRWPPSLVVRAEKAISKGENISTVLVSPVMCTFDRQVDLRKRRNTYCECARCSDRRELGSDFGTLKCSKEGCAGWVLPVNTPEVDKSDWKCESCGKNRPASDIEKPMCILHKEVEKLLGRPYVAKGRLPSQDELKNAPKYEAALTRMKTFVHPNHYFCFGLKRRLYEIYGRPDLNATIRSSYLTDYQLERVAVLARDVAIVLDNPAFNNMFHDYFDAASCLLYYATGELAKRKLGSKQWTKAQAEQAKQEARRIYSRGIQ